jgi:hypothetical protein
MLCVTEPGGVLLPMMFELAVTLLRWHFALVVLTIDGLRGSDPVMGVGFNRV